MIDYFESSMTDIMPDNLRGDPHIQAISHAISIQIRKLITFSIQTSLLAVIDQLEEEKLDLLAVELRTQYYGDFLSLSEKRSILKKTLLWYYRAGTLSTVQELTDFIFRNAAVEEWFDYDSKPYLFRLNIQIIDQDISLDMYLRYLQSLKEVKNTRSHLEAIIYKHHTEAKVRSVAVGGLGNELKIKGWVAAAIEGLEAEENAAAVLRQSQQITVKSYDDIGLNDVYILSEKGVKTKVRTDNSFIKII